MTGAWQVSHSGRPQARLSGRPPPARNLPVTPAPPALRRDPSSRRQEKAGILREELVTQPSREMGRAEIAQIVIEVAELRPQRQGEDSGLAG